MLKTHYRPSARCGMALCRRLPGPVSEDPADVTCRDCLRAIERLGIRPRSEFPEVPTFEVQAVNAVNVMFRCPRCGKENWHGKGDGHRVAHCGCWPRGYVIVEAPAVVGPSWASTLSVANAAENR